MHQFQNFRASQKWPSRLTEEDHWIRLAGFQHCAFLIAAQLTKHGQIIFWVIRYGACTWNAEDFREREIYTDLTCHALFCNQDLSTEGQLYHWRTMILALDIYETILILAYYSTKVTQNAQLALHNGSPQGSSPCVLMTIYTTVWSISSSFMPNLRAPQMETESRHFCSISK